MAKLYNINPYNEKDMSYLREYDNSLYDSLINISKEMTEKVYEGERIKSVSTDDYYYTLKDDKVDNFYKVVTEKDRKASSIYTKLKTKNKAEILSLTNMLLIVDGIEDVFTFIDYDENFINKLRDEGFILLGDEKNKIVMQKEQEKENENYKERSISWK